MGTLPLQPRTCMRMLSRKGENDWEVEELECALTWKGYSCIFNLYVWGEKVFPVKFPQCLLYLLRAVLPKLVGCNPQINQNGLEISSNVIVTIALLQSREGIFQLSGRSSSSSTPLPQAWKCCKKEKNSVLFQNRISPSFYNISKPWGWPQKGSQAPSTFQKAI